MMMTIFDRETEVGKCSYEPEGYHHGHYSESEYATIYAHTRASLNGHRGMLKIEQHCFLRQGAELPDQPWIKPQVLLEPALGSQEESIRLAEKLHEEFLERIKTHFPEQYLV